MNFLLRYREGTGPIRITMRLGRDANQAKARLRAERKGRDCKIIGCK